MRSRSGPVFLLLSVVLSSAPLMALTIDTDTVPNPTVGQVYPAFTITTSGGAGPVTWSFVNAPSPPNGFVIGRSSTNPTEGIFCYGAATTGSSAPVCTGALTGSGGIFNFVLQATDGATTVQKAFTFEIENPLRITTSELPQTNVLFEYVVQLAVAGGVGPYTWEVTEGALPAGITLGADTGRLTGTAPLESGTYAFTAQVTDNDSMATASRRLLLTVNGSVQILTTGLPQTVLNQPMTPFTFTATGGTDYTWSQPNGWTLPEGLVLSEQGELSGTPTIAGTYRFAVQVTSSSQALPVAKFFTMHVILGDLSITDVGLPATVAGIAYQVVLTPAGGLPPYQWAFDTLETQGLAIHPNTGTIFGTPGTVGNFDLPVVITDATGNRLIRNFTLVVTGPLAISTVTLPTGFSGAEYLTVLGATGGQPPYRWTITAGLLPPGLAIDGVAGRISGIPSANGTFPFVLTVADFALATANRSVSITIQPGMAIGSGAVPDGVTGSPYSHTFTVSGALGPVTWSVISGTPPAGLLLNASSGTISGTPTAAGTSTFTVRAADGISTPADRIVSITIVQGFAIGSGALPDGVLGSPYSHTLTVVGALGPVTWSVISGTPPAELLLNATSGTISGTPTSAGTSTFTVRAADGVSTPAERVVSITIVQALGITTSTLPNGTQGTAYSQALAATGGTTPYTWTLLSGTLPDGLELSAAGVISGTPTDTGASSFQVRVADAGSQTASASFTITVNAVAGELAIITGNLNGPAGAAFSQTLAATGGVAPYTWTNTTALPAGLALSTEGLISGTPTVSGSFDVTFQATDQASTVASKVLTITIGVPPLPAVSFTSLPDSSPAARQPSVSVNLAEAYPLNVTGTLTLTFASNVGGDDQTVQFSTGSRTLGFTIPAGASQATFTGGTPAVLTGTVSGTITISSQFTAGGETVTPAPTPVKTITVEVAPPVISGVTLQRSGSTLTVVVTGYATSREMTSGTYRFSAGSGNSLAQSDIPVALTSAFTTWFASAASNVTGGQFRLTVPFTVQGDATAVNLVSVTLTNARGNSAAVGP